MWARVSRFEGPIDRVDEDIRGIGEVVEKAKQMAGFRGLYYLVNRESGQTVAVTLWEDEQAMRASEEGANRIRQESAGRTAAVITAVEHYEVVAQP